MVTVLHAGRLFCASERLLTVTMLDVHWLLSAHNWTSKLGQPNQATRAKLLSESQRKSVASNLSRKNQPSLLMRVRVRKDGYHVAYLGPRGDTFAADVTELSVTEVSAANIIPA